MINFGSSLYNQGILDVIRQNQDIRENCTNYIQAFDTIIYFEEAEKQVHLNQFNKFNIQLNFHMDEMFYFPVTVCIHIKSIDKII